jgi:hypothetical protein
MEVVMKREFKEFKEKALSEIESRLKHLCGRPSPAKRLIAVLAVCAALAAVNIWFVVSSICSIGKNDAQKELIKLQHIETPELQKSQLENKNKNNQLKGNENEYRQSDEGREQEQPVR